MLELPYPAKALWPNGRAHWAVKARQTKLHRQWAYDATLAARSSLPATVARLTWTLYPKPRGPVPDKDGIVASMKAYQDGICDALGINDRDLGEPRIIIGERTKHGGAVATLSEE